MQKTIVEKQQSTPAIFEDDERWQVTTQNETYILSGKQAQLLKDATTKGLRGLVWFKDCAISIPHIVSVSKIQDSEKIVNKKRYEFAKHFGMKNEYGR